MTIKDGYNGKVTHISIDTNLDYAGESLPKTRMAGLNIDQTGVKRNLIGKTQVPYNPEHEYKDFEVVQDQNGIKFSYKLNVTEVEGLETRSLLTLDELLDLRDTCNQAIKALTQ